MKKNEVLWYFTLLLFFGITICTISVHGQEQKHQIRTLLSGTITDSKTGKPLDGVTVELERTKKQVKTNSIGKFQFDSDDKFPINIIVSSLGYNKKYVVVHENESVITLDASDSNLDEVVVIGYGTQRRRDLTGSVASVSKDILAYNLSPSVDGLLGGAIAGVHVSQASGQPGAPATIRIRGGNSINASNNPLYVIDGFIFFSDNSSTKVGLSGIEGELNPLSLLNPTDIESIEVLKDVSATAIYGSRGSNGVILITTKKGRAGRSAIDYQYTVGVANSAKKLNLLNAQQWARLQKDYFLNKPGYSDQQIQELGDGYDWQDAVLQKGITQNHSFSISGGDEKSTYFISGNYLDQEGVVLNSGFKRFVARTNYDREVLPKLHIGLHVTGSKSTQNTLSTFEAVNYNTSPYSAGIANSLTYALYMPPVVPFYDEKGGYNYSNPFEYAYLREGSITANPISDLKNSTAETMLSSLLGNFYAQFKPFEGFTAKVSVGTNIGHTTQNYFSPSYTAIGLAPKGIGGIGNKRTEILLSEFTLSYVKKINEIHAFDILGGYTVQNTKTNFVTNLSSKFTNEALGVNNLQDGKPYGSSPITSGLTESKLYSLLGRVNYSFHQRYHLTANVRSDYSTRFAADHKWGLFPSVGLAWNINDEYFLKDAKSLNNLKLRASVGTVGNQEIGDYEYVQFLDAVHYGDGVAYRVGNAGNKDLKWESTAQYNLGIDAGFLNNRISVSADVYEKKTTDLLLKIPPKLGEENEQLVNVGNLTNKGVEFSLNTVLVDNGKVNWSISGNLAHNTNKITKLYDGVTEKILGVEILRVGESLGSFYGQIFDGVVQQGDDISKLPTSPSYNLVQPGDPKLRDINKDGHIDPNDRTILGSKQPNFTYGFSSTVKYKGFDLFFLAQGVQGNSVYNLLRRYLERPTDAYNVSATLLDSWTPSHPSAHVPRITSTPFSSELDSRYVEDASFLRLRTLTLGYSIKESSPLARKLALSNIRFYVTGQNLFTITNYKGYDPEVSRGIDLGAYPMPRTFLAGINIQF